MKRIKFFDKYEYYFVTVLLVIDFGITSIIWVAASPLLNLYFKIDSIILFITTPLMPILLQFIIKSLSKTGPKKMDDQKTKDIFRILIFIFNFFLFGMSLVMQFLEFNIVSYQIMRMLWIPIILPYVILMFRPYFKEHFRWASVIIGLIVILLMIGSFYWFELDILYSYDRWVTHLSIAICIVIALVIYSMYSFFNRRRNKT